MTETKQSSPDDNPHYCKMCLKETPPRKTLLIVGLTISEYRMNHKDYLCNEHNTIRNKVYKEAKFGEYKERQHMEAIELLTKQWNDPAYKDIKEIADRVYKVWNKYNRRLPKDGIKTDWACEVVFADLWFIDPNTIAEEYFRERNITGIRKQHLKPAILDYICSRLEHETEYYRIKARNKWAGIVDAIQKKYAGEDKLVATPKHIDPYTKENMPNWYLLTREPERKEREDTRNAQIESRKRINEQEKELINNIEEQQKARAEKLRQEELNKQKKKNSNTKDTNDNNKDSSNEGGE